MQKRSKGDFQSGGHVYLRVKERGVSDKAYRFLSQDICMGFGPSYSPQIDRELTWAEIYLCYRAM